MCLPTPIPAFGNQECLSATVFLHVSRKSYCEHVTVW
uniref:Uncharacterized protein n=1 Tax=Mesocestoides corti TaxID=53468 RepID=A0A5K3ES00_MESCO